MRSHVFCCCAATCACVCSLHPPLSLSTSVSSANVLLLQMSSGSTTAPKLLTEADLLTLMAKNEIGTHTHEECCERANRGTRCVLLTPSFTPPPLLCSFTHSLTCTVCALQARMRPWRSTSRRCSSGHTCVKPQTANSYPPPSASPWSMVSAAWAGEQGAT